MIPTAVAILLLELQLIFPELFIQLYYFAALLRSSLLRMWAKSPEVRTHTRFIIMDRLHWLSGPLNVVKLEHVPHTSCPFRFDLPLLPSLCGCWDKHALWKSQYASTTFSEQFCFYHLSGCSFELHLTILTGKRILLQAHGTTIMQEPWDPVTKNFSFDDTRMVHMQVSVSSPRFVVQCTKQLIFFLGHEAWS